MHNSDPGDTISTKAYTLEFCDIAASLTEDLRDYFVMLQEGLARVEEIGAHAETLRPALTELKKCITPERLTPETCKFLDQLHGSLTQGVQVHADILGQAHALGQSLSPAIEGMTELKGSIAKLIADNT